MDSVEIDGPLGPFHVPAEPPECRRITTGLSRGVWGAPGRYDLPDPGQPEYAADGVEWSRARSMLDVGAGWGAFAVWVRSVAGPHVVVECFEPHAHGCDFIAKNDPRAIVHRAAVTSQPSARLRVGDDWGASSTHFDDGGGEDVPVIHPRDLPIADAIKIDAEGVEAEVLGGLTDAQWGALRIVVYEWHTPELRAECREIVERRGGLRLVEDRDGPWGQSNGVAFWVRT